MIIKRKYGFTLVEILIVILIIGILAAAIIPKITGVMSRARDIKRIADLRNIASAIEQYRMDYGVLPKRTISDLEKNLLDSYWGKRATKESLPYYGYVSGLKDSFQEYLTEIPKDPQNNTTINIHYDYFSCRSKSKNNIWCLLQEIALKKGEYLYQFFNSNGHIKQSAVLVAKVENSNSANRVFLPKNKTSINTMWQHPLYIFSPTMETKNWNIQNLYLCSSIKKVKKGKEVGASETTTECSYSSEDQLYYIVKIE